MTAREMLASNVLGFGGKQSALLRHQRMQSGPASQTIRWGPSSGALACSDAGGNKAACGFVLLGVVEAKHGVQPVEQAT